MKSKQFRIVKKKINSFFIIPDNFLQNFMVCFEILKFKVQIIRKTC